MFESSLKCYVKHVWDVILFFLVEFSCQILISLNFFRCFTAIQKEESEKKDSHLSFALYSRQIFQKTKPKLFFYVIGKVSLFFFVRFSRARKRFVSKLFWKLLFLFINANSSSFKIGKWWYKYKQKKLLVITLRLLKYFFPVERLFFIIFVSSRNLSISFSLLSLFFIIYYFLYKFGENVKKKPNP